MINILTPVLTFLFVFSIIWIAKTVLNFIGALVSTPPKTFEISKIEILYHGLLLSYIITFLIYT
jgi:hypothetical protein